MKSLFLAVLVLGPLLGVLSGCGTSSPSPACTRDCSGRFCGSDGCGGTCGSCGGVTPVCSGATCVAACTPDCTGRVCGNDGCGGTCGTCPGGTPVCASGSCIAACVPDCAGKACGDNGCGGTCGTCSGGTPICAAGACVASCSPSCAGKTCGDDGCGGSCGPCGAGTACQLGTCAAPTALYGRVTDGVNPAEGVAIQVDNLSAATDANGDYRIESVVPGTKTLRARKDYHLPASVTLKVTAGSSTRADLALTAIGELHGRLTDSNTSDGIAGAEVTVGVLTSYSGADGSYYVTGITPGTYQLSIHKAGYSPVASWLAIPGGQPTILDRVLDQSGIVTGTVTTAVGGLPIGGATVFGGGAVTTTNGAGEFTLTGVSAGGQAILATAIGYDTSSVDVTLAPGGSAIANLSLSLTSTAPSACSGHVYDGDSGTPLAGATVTINNRSTVTAVDGSYSLSGVTPTASSYNSYAQKAGYSTVYSHTPIPGGASLVRDFTIKALRTVFVVVSDASTHLPIQGASVSPGGTTGAAGWTMAQAVSGTTTFRVTAAGYRDQTIAFDVPATPSSTFTVELLPVPVVCGVVTNSVTRERIGGAAVELLLYAYSYASTTSGGDGTYCISSPEGMAAYDYPWAIGASRMGFTNGMTSFRFSVTGAVTADVTLAPAGLAP